MSPKINADTTIGTLMENFPEHATSLEAAMTRYGLHCVGCSANAFESLKQGVLGHGFWPPPIPYTLRSQIVLSNYKTSASTPEPADRQGPHFRSIATFQTRACAAGRLWVENRSFAFP